MEIRCSVGSIGGGRGWVLIKVLLLLMLKLVSFVVVMAGMVVVPRGMIRGIINSSNILAEILLRMLKIEGRVHGLVEYRYEI